MRVLGTLRQWYENASLPLGRTLARAGLSPNMLTGLSLAVSAASGYEYFLGSPLFGALLLLGAGIVDMADGAIARATSGGTRFGSVLDHVADRYSEFFVVLGMLLGQLLPLIVGLFSLFGMIMASFTRAKAESVGGLDNCSVGIAERQEKLGLILIGSAFFYVDIRLLTAAVLLVGLLSHITVVQRLLYTRKMTSS